MSPSPERRVTLAAFALAVLLSAGSAFALDSGKPMPELGVKDLSGRVVNLASLKGKVVIVDFWATWCAPCKEELPVLEALQKKYGKDGLVVVAVSVDSDASKVRAFVKKMRLTLHVVHDADHKLAERYNPAKMPSSYVVDRKGRVRHVHGGFRKPDAKKLEAEVRGLL